MSTHDQALQTIARRLGITPTEHFWNEFVYEYDAFDLYIKRAVSGKYEATLDVDGDRRLDITCRDPHMLADLLHTALYSYPRVEDQLLEALTQLADDLTILGLGRMATERPAYLEAAQMVRELRDDHTNA